MDDKRRASILGMIGLCRRAGCLIMGSNMVCEALASRQPPSLVLVSATASEATVDRIARKCFFYNTKCLVLTFSPEELGKAVGKTAAVATLGIRSDSFAGRIAQLAEE